MKRLSQACRLNKRLAERVWGRLSPHLLASLQGLTSSYGFSVGRGDIMCLDGRWYVTHAGLLRLSSRRGCSGMHTEIVSNFCDPSNNRWTFKATVFRNGRAEGFAAYGDADPSNVSFLVHGAEMRVAETRAVNRALRKAYGIGICSVEEIGSLAEPPQPPKESKKLPPQPTNGSHGSPTSSRSPLPIDSTASTRLQLGQGLRHGFLRRQGASRRHPGAGGKLRQASGRLGRERS